MSPEDSGSVATDGGGSGSDDAVAGGPSRDTNGGGRGGADEGSPRSAGRADGDRPPAAGARGGLGGGEETDPRDGPVAALRWLWTTDHGTISFVRELVVSVAAVALVGLVLFAISGVWPPMVAVESGSMEPHMYRGDLVFLTDQHRFVDEAAYGETGVVTHRDGAAAGYVSFGDYGDVVVFSANGRSGTPIIHRVRFWVDAGENWYPQANEAYLPGGAGSCDALAYCPAPHAGFITKGDANRYYDQANRISAPVRPEWIRGTAELRIPWLGHVRLAVSELIVGSATPAARSPATVQRPVDPLAEGNRTVGDRAATG